MWLKLVYYRKSYFMKNTLILLVLLFRAMACYSQWPMHFDSGTYPTNPIWHGDTGSFQLSGGLLQLKATTFFQPARIATLLPPTLGDTLTWHLWLRLGFSPSSSNQFRWYLWQDQPVVSDSIGESYYLQVGETGSLDAPELYHQVGTQHTLLGRGRSGGWSRSDNRLRLQVLALPSGQWMLRCDTLAGYHFADTLWQPPGLHRPTTGGYGGFWAKFTSSNAQRFWIDEFHWGDWPSTPVQSASCRSPLSREIVFNEVMADPSPALFYPEAEWLELKNRTDDTLCLQGLGIADTRDTVTLPDFKLLPHQELVLSTVSIVPGTLILPRLPSLNNEGDSLVLLSPDKVVIDRLIYRVSQFVSSWKANGGWSLERINPDRLCRQMENWAESVSETGATPGLNNSRLASLPDSGLIRMVNVFPDQMNTLRITFSEPPEEAVPAFELEAFSGTWKWEGTLSNRPHEGRLTLSDELQFGKYYRIKLKSLGVCGLAADTASLLLALPEAPDSGKVQISEIYFKPENGEDEFIELVNNGDKVVDLSWLTITKSQDVQIPDEVVRMAEQGRLFFPGERLVLTASKASGRWNGCNSEVLVVPNFPSLTDDGAYLGVARWSGPWLDLVAYREDWKHPALSDIRGISLERLDFNQSGLLRSSWLSASDQARKTPGCPNSQTGFQSSAGKFQLSSRYFTPGTNGALDFLEITYQPPSAGFSCKLKLVDLSGRVLMEWPELLGGEQVKWRWEGFTGSGSPVQAGWLIAVLEANHPNGTTDQAGAAFAIIPDGNP